MEPLHATSGNSTVSAANTTCCSKHSATVLKTAALAAVVFATYAVSSAFLPSPILATTVICASLALIVLMVMKLRPRIPLPTGISQNFTAATSHVSAAGSPAVDHDHARKASSDALHTELKKKFGTATVHPKNGVEKADLTQLQTRMDQLEKALKDSFEKQLEDIGKLYNFDLCALPCTAQLQSKFNDLQASLDKLKKPDLDALPLTKKLVERFDQLEKMPASLQQSIDALAQKVESRFSALQQQIAAVSEQQKVKVVGQEKQLKSAVVGHVRVPSSLDAEQLPSLNTIVIPLPPPVPKESGLKTPPKPALERRKSYPSPQVKKIVSQGGNLMADVQAKASAAAIARAKSWISPMKQKANDKKEGITSAAPAGSIQSVLLRSASTIRQAVEDLSSPAANPSVKKKLSTDWDDSGDDTDLT